MTGARFVQDRIAAECEEVWFLLEAGAQVYVCGGGRPHGSGVRAAFCALHLGHTSGVREDDAETWLQSLIDAGRYVQDAYAAR
ncbi:hypothetical protein [Kitasatospora sp. NPDC097691]|uniref:hypothetical protein n=1 Tax=Kitasatospora sp. NPDC097691 TaxID=3157231 RepID=UPI0033242927